VIRARADDAAKVAEETVEPAADIVAAKTVTAPADTVDEGQLDLEGTAAATPAQIFENYAAGDSQPEDAAETVAAAAPADTVFIPAAPVMPPVAEKVAAPVAPTGPLHAEAPINAPSPAETPKRGNLFRQITRIGLAAKSEPAKPAVAKEPAVVSAPTKTAPSNGREETGGQARLGGLDAASESDDALLDIPAFLRRQAN
ncbi:MAG: hypothetical protein ACPGVX_06355, partial [Thalassobaculaceae bacterium]